VRAIVIALTAALGGCGAPVLVPLVETAGVPLTVTPPGTIPLEVVTRSTGIPDPLPVRGARVAYGEVESALGHAVASAAVPWADAHRAQRPDGWQLLVELTHAEAERLGPRMVVGFGVRATLRTRTGNFYLAQTQAHCRDASLVAPAEGAGLIFGCMSRIGRELGGWLGGVQP
jgi:hypothetical protein